MFAFKPMLAAAVSQIEEVRYPVLGSPKLDGIRALAFGRGLVSRNLKNIPSKLVQEMFAKLPEGLDGELIVGDPAAKDCFRRTSSAVMSVDNADAKNAVFYAFDKFNSKHKSYAKRLEEVRALTKQFAGLVKPVPHVPLQNAFELYTYEETMLEKGFEGVMLRDPAADYKFGRSTAKEGGLLKLKRFADSEALVLGVEELQHNNNAQTRDALGRAKRSSHKAGKAGAGMLGAWLVKDIHTGAEFSVGSGMTEDDRKQFWARPERHVGQVIKYRFFPSGSKDKPRFPVFIGFRHLDDM